MSPILDMLIQLKNAQARSRENIFIPYSSLKFAVAEVLKKYGFIEDVEKKKRKMKKSEVPWLSIKLKYNDGIGAITGMKFVSKPSRRIYSAIADLKPVRSGFGISILSTSKGIMTGDEAKKNRVGGEMLFIIW